MSELIFLLYFTPIQVLVVLDEELQINFDFCPLKIQIIRKQNWINEMVGVGS